MAWTKTDAESISKAVGKIIDRLHKMNDDNEKVKHAMHGQDLNQHATAKAAEFALQSVKGTFDSIAFSKGRKKR